MINDKYSVNRLATAANVGTGHTWENLLIGAVQKNLAGKLDNRYESENSGVFSQCELV